MEDIRGIQKEANQTIRKISIFKRQLSDARFLTLKIDDEIDSTNRTIQKRNSIMKKYSESKGLSPVEVKSIIEKNFGKLGLKKLSELTVWGEGGSYICNLSKETPEFVATSAKVFLADTTITTAHSVGKLFLEKTIEVLNRADTKRSKSLISVRDEIVDEIDSLKELFAISNKPL